MQLGEPIPELGGRTWAELEVIEHPEDSTLLFKDQLRRRKPDGSVELIDVRVRILRPSQLAAARVSCRALCKRLNLDIDKDSDLFEEFEQICQLSIAIRAATAPYPQFADPDELLNRYDEASLQDILARIKQLKNVLDVRETDLTEEQMWKKIAAVAEVGHLLPLTDIAGHEQPSLLLFMACQACKSPRAPSWLQSIANSTREHLAAMNSNESSAEPSG